MDTVKCSRCKALFSKIDGSNYATRYYGDKVYRYYMCNVCNTARVKKYRQTVTGKANILRAVYKSQKKFQYKQNARAVLGYHVKKGNILKPTKCERCLEETKVEAHHTDYTKPLAVFWFCRKCHRNIEKLAKVKQ